jgi:CLIP-associating protein 1/2
MLESTSFIVVFQPEDNLEYAMIVLWELFERHYTLLEGHEADIFSALLRVRYSNKANVSIVVTKKETVDA